MISDLSSELHLMVISHLPNIDRVRLKITNHYFFDIIAPLTEVANIVQIRRKLNRARKCRTALWLECPHCLRIRRVSKFADNEYRVAVARMDKHWDPIIGSSHRCCLECAIKEGSNGYRTADIVVVQNRYHVVCARCRQLGMLASPQYQGICKGCCAGAEAAANGSTDVSQEFV